MSIEQQCDLVGINRSSYYYKPCQESEFNLLLMRLIDEEYTKHPFYGSRRMTAWLCSKGYQVNRKRVQRLFGLMGLEAIYPKPNLSKSGGHQKYPYLLTGLIIDRPNMVWSTDITYIRTKNGYVYCVAIIDWGSRYVLAWRLSNTLDSAFCIETLLKALELGTPKIFNTDQGVQFTSLAFLQILRERQIQISMDSKGRALDNIFIERLWRSVKYEEVYLKDYQGMQDAEKGLCEYFEFYNNERLHQSLDYHTPCSVHYELI